MKILVLGDIHGRKFWREVITNNIEKVDKIIFLGDYLDPYPEEISSTSELMECNDFFDSENLLNMLNDIVSLKKNEPEKFILLTGNHTSSYIWPEFSAATRTDRKNYEKYHNFFLENLNLFNLVWVENDVIFSHAGISEGWANHVWKQLKHSKNEKLSSIMEIAIMLQDTPLTDFTEPHIAIISDISYFRLGKATYGSCEWADLKEHVNFRESITKIIPKGEDGIYQIFGHTQLKEALITEKWACLDCRKGFIVDTLTYEITEC